MNFAKRVNIDDYRAVTNTSLQFPYAKELCLWGRGARGNYSFIADLSLMFQFSKLTHLSIQCPDFGLIQLTEFLSRLPNLVSLTLFTNTSYLTVDPQTQLIESLPIHNSIQYLIVRGRCVLDQIYLLMHLCPRVKSMELDIEEEHLEPIVRFLLTGRTSSNLSETKKAKSSTLKEKFSSLFSRSQNKKAIPSDVSSSDYFPTSMHHASLSSLCFLNFDAIMEQKLERLMERERLLDDYSTLFLFNYLFLWW